MNRRRFLTVSAATAAGLAAGGQTGGADAAAPLAGNWLVPTPAKLPRWRGFNLTEKFIGEFNQPFLESDFAWMNDCLDLGKEAGWGWAMWNFRGALGVLDRNRKDVVYENHHGHKLDRKMLELLRSFS